MLRTVLLVFGLLLPFGASFAEVADDELAIVPGKRVGWITRNITRGDLRQFYGDARIELIYVHVGEGEYCKASRVHFESYGFLDVIWLNFKDDAKPESVEVNGDYWNTAEGINLGTTLADLEKLNGRPFLLAGFDWDNAGIVTSWEGGKLEKYKNGLVLLLGASRQKFEKLSPEQISQVTGSQNISSTHPVMRKLNPSPYRLKVILAPGKYCESVYGPDLEKRNGNQ